MKKNTSYTVFGLGTLLFAAIQTANNFFEVTVLVHGLLLGIAIGIQITGLILISKSPEFKNNKLRQWKLGLIGKGEKRQQRSFAQHKTSILPLAVYNNRRAIEHYRSMACLLFAPKINRFFN